MNLENVHLRGTRALQPAAATVPEGSLYFVTDELVLERRNAAVAWESYSGAGTIANDSVTFAKTQNIATARILGRTTAASGDIEELTVGAGLSLAAGVLNTVAQVVYKVLGITIDGGGVAITTGVKGYLRVPKASTITKVTMLADVSGSIVVDIWKDTYANYPPVVGDTIVAAAKPTITTAIKSEDATLTGWTTAIAAGDVLGFKVDSCTSITKLTLELEVTQ